MIVKQLIATAAVGLCLVAGCDDKSKSSAKSSTPADPSATSVATTPATDARPAITVAADLPADAPATRPAEGPHSTFYIASGNSPRAIGFNFPRARLHIDREQKIAVLYSDDPKNAIDAKYAGNGYYMVIPLSDDSLQRLDGYQWHYKAASSEHQDSADGIFLEGQRYHLQPSEMVVTFTGDAPVANIMLEGTFNQFDMTQSAREGFAVQVKGLVSALVDAVK